MTDDDWAPLPPEQLVAQPGELVEPAPRAPAPPAPAVERAAPPPSPAEQRAAELAVAALQAKLARAAPATSLVAAVHHREQKVARRQRAQLEPQLGELLVRDGGPAPVVEYAPGRDGRDEREESDWFRALPAAEQERLRAVWAEKRVVQGDTTSRARRIGNRRFVASLVVFAAVWALGTHVAWPATLGAGVLAGLWWRHTSPDRFLDPVRAVSCFFGLQSLALLVNDGSNPLLWVDAVLVVALAALVGFDGEMRRSGGFDVR